MRETNTWQRFDFSLINQGRMTLSKYAGDKSQCADEVQQSHDLHLKGKQ